MERIIVVGGGWAGAASALSAANQGAEEIVLLEKSDMLLGTGLVGGIFRNNGRFTAAQEGLAMGMELFALLDALAVHKYVRFPGHSHSFVYDTERMEAAVRKLLRARGVRILFHSRVIGLNRNSVGIRELKVYGVEQSYELSGSAYVDATGTAGPPAFCNRLGGGCAMCVLRCPAFGGRVGLVELLGVELDTGAHETYAVSGSCKLAKSSLAPQVRATLEERGVYHRFLPEGIRGELKHTDKACQQYSAPEFSRSLIILDTGEAKLMRPYLPLHLLHRIPGFFRARYVDPYAGGRGNSVRFNVLAERDDYLRVGGMKNIFCAGEKAGLVVGHTEAIITGTLAGYNAVRVSRGRPPVQLPCSTACGDFIHYAGQRVKDGGEGLHNRYTFSGSTYFRRMKDKGLYSLDCTLIEERVAQANLTGLFSGGR